MSGAPVPLVSVITAVRNGSQHIAQTIESVIAQDYPNVEHIVVDGASTDGTQGIVERYRDRLAHFVSEPDSGLADAWNKGLRLARGDYIAFLNADDFYRPGFLSSSMEAATGSEREVLYGAIQVLGPGDVPLRVVDSIFNASKVAFGFCFRHPECLTHRELFAAVGPFDESVRIAVDADFMLRCLAAGAEFRKSRGVVSMRAGGMSDRYWHRTTVEFLSRARAHGFLSPWVWLMHRWLMPLRLLNRRWGLMPAARRAREAARIVLLNAFHALHVRAPAACRHWLYRLGGFRVAAGASIAADTRFSAFGHLWVGRDARIGEGVQLDNRAAIRIAERAHIGENVSILTGVISQTDPLMRERFAGVSIGAAALIGPRTRIMPGAVIEPGAVVAPDSVVEASS